jgi:hypothetical protein
MTTQYGHRDGSTRTGSAGKGSGSAVATPPSSKRAGRQSSVHLTHEQIEERARLIWKQRGCPRGEDEKNWYEAETQLKRELSGS